MRRFIPFAALLGVAFVLGCQDLGTGVVASDGPGPQFAQGGKGKGGGGGGGTGSITLSDGMIGTTLSSQITNNGKKFTIYAPVDAGHPITMKLSVTGCEPTQNENDDRVPDLMMLLEDGTSIDNGHINATIDKRALVSGNHDLIANTTFPDLFGDLVVRIGLPRQHNPTVALGEDGSFVYTGGMARATLTDGPPRNAVTVLCTHDGSVTVKPIPD